MKRLTRNIAAAVLAGFAFPVLVALASGSLVIPAGSTLHVKLGTTLTSKTNESGDLFTGMVSQAVVANGQEVVPAGSTVEGHVAFVKPSGRVRGKAEMRIIIDRIITPDDVKVPLSAGLQDTNAGPCAKTSDEEGTIKGCGKSNKDLAESAGLAGAMGAGAGASVGLGHEIECEYYGMCGGHGMGADIGYGAAIGAGTALIYHIFKHEKEIILVQGTEMVFVVNRSTDAAAATQAAANQAPPTEAAAAPDAAPAAPAASAPQH